MIRDRFQYKSTITTILAEQDGSVRAAREAMMGARNDLETLIAKDLFFGTTFAPYRTEESAPLIAERMMNAAESATTGPMAAVAGTIAWAGAEAIKQAGASCGVVDNGGDIALFSDRELLIGLYAGQSPFSGKYALRIPPTNNICGICTSSATVGPSISFGTADAVTVFSADVARADAWATALCNQVTSASGDGYLPPDDPAITGCLLICGSEMGQWGEVPEIVRAKVDEGRITVGDPALL